MHFEFTGDWMPRSGNAPVFPQDIIAVGNLECAFADGDVASGKAYSSIVAHSLLDDVAKCGFSALSVANNHAYDAGEKAFDSAVETLRQGRKVQIFGTTDCPYAIFGNVFIIGCLEPCRSRGPRIFKEEDVLPLIKQLKATGSGDKSGVQPVVFVYPHWGKEGEYTRYPSPAQRKLACRWIDAGAAGVIGSHSHVPQGREYYNGRPIYYSLGNYDFRHPESSLYAGTTDRLTVSLEIGAEAVSRISETFSPDSARAAVEEASAALADWNTWRWAKAVGPFNIRKNMASWRIRLKKNFIKTFPKFIIWQFLPKVILFRVAGLFGETRSCR